MALVRCRNCLGTKKLTVLKTVNRGDGTNVITGSTEEDCPECDGEGVVRIDVELPTYYMRQNFTDGSAAVMARAGDPWTVIRGPLGYEPQADEDSQARDFALTQNALHMARISATFDDHIGG